MREIYLCIHKMWQSIRHGLGQILVGAALGHFFPVVSVTKNPDGVTVVLHHLLWRPQHHW